MSVLRYRDPVTGLWLPVAPGPRGPKGDKGDKGDTGDLANLDIGTVTTGSPAAAHIDGNFEDGYELDLTLPSVGAGSIHDADVNAAADIAPSKIDGTAITAVTLPAATAHKSNRAEAWVDWTARPDGTPTALDSGHALALYRNSYGAGADFRVVSGVLRNIADTADLAYSYAEVHLSDNVSRIGVEWVIQAGGGSPILCVWKSHITDINTIPDAPCHLQIGKTEWKFGVFTGNVLTDILTGTYGAPLAEGVTLRAEVYLIGDTAWILLPDNTWHTVTDSRIATNAGEYPCWEVGTLDASTAPCAHITRMWADSGQDYRDSIGTLTQALTRLRGIPISNTESGTNAAARTGASNTASATHSTVGGGLSNTASGDYATVLGGRSNLASPEYSTAVGYQAKPPAYGGLTHASGMFAAQGDAQVSDFVLRATTTDATPTNMGTDGSPTYMGKIPVAAVQSYACEALVVARLASGSYDQQAAYRVSFCVGRDLATIVQTGSTEVVVLGETDAAWTIAVDVDVTYNMFTLQVTGGAGQTVHWVASLRCVGAI